MTSMIQTEAVEGAKKLQARRTICDKPVLTVIGHTNAEEQ